MPSFGPLVNASAIGEPNVVVADVRWALGSGADRAGYEAGHIPGAVFVDLDRDLSGVGGGRHPLPTPAAFAAAMSRLGIGDDTPVIAYDDTAGSIAARLWWMLSVLDHPVALLDGGLQAWSGPLESGPATARPPDVFTEKPWPAEALVDADSIAAGHWHLIDARAPERYRGETEPVDARPGHIPGAVNVPWSGNVDSSGRFLPAEELAVRFNSPTDAQAVVYCGSGVTACHDALAMEMAGLPRPRLYAGSWSDWSADPARPAEVTPQ
jgi:thiosulfate/3-mercaptopyruvate sulfurtransferase